MKSLVQENFGGIDKIKITDLLHIHTWIYGCIYVCIEPLISQSGG